MSNQEPLKTCRFCGLKAYTENDLKKFRKQKQAKGGYLNLCNDCRNKRERPEIYKAKQERKKLFEKGLKRCTQCKKIKILDDFYKITSGYKSICKQCDYDNHKKWRAKNPEMMRFYNRKSYITTRDKIRYQALQKLCGEPVKCCKCGFSDFRALAIDHINNDGAEERKSGLRSNNLCRYILKLSDEKARKRYQVLCANCNWIKRVEQRREGGEGNAIRTNSQILV